MAEGSASALGRGPETGGCQGEAWKSLELSRVPQHPFATHSPYPSFPDSELVGGGGLGLLGQRRRSLGRVGAC